MNKILPICLFVLVGSIPCWAANPIAVDIEIVDQEASAYVLYSDGYIQTTGFAVFYGAPVTNSEAVELVLTQSQKGYYILTTDGTIYSFGDAVVLNQPLSDDVPFVDMELYPDSNSPYFLRADGSIITVHRDTFFGETRRDQNAVDMELTPDGQGYYVLYEDGLIAFFGTALNRGFIQNDQTRAVDLELLDNGYYVTLENGTILAFGDAVVMPFSTTPTEDVKDMVLTTQGYRILLANGEVQEFIRVDRQGQARWFAQISPRSLQPQQQTPTPTATPRPTASFFVFEQSGFSETIVGRLPEGIFLPDTLDSGFTSLFSGGLFVATASDEGEAARNIRFYNRENEGLEFTGELFASLAPERGEAFIRGLQYSNAGLYVAVDDAQGIMILRIEGDFGDADVNDFSLY